MPKRKSDQICQWDEIGLSENCCFFFSSFSIASISVQVNPLLLTFSRLFLLFCLIFVRQVSVWRRLLFALLRERTFYFVSVRNSWCRLKHVRPSFALRVSRPDNDVLKYYLNLRAMATGNVYYFYALSRAWYSMHDDGIQSAFNHKIQWYTSFRFLLSPWLSHFISFWFFSSLFYMNSRWHMIKM